MFIDFFILALKNITHRKRRSWLTIIGILIGIAAVVALLSLGQGLSDSITTEFESIGSDKIFINPGGDPTGNQFAENTAKLTDDDLQAVRRTRGVAEAAGALFRTVQVRYRDQNAFPTLVGVPMDHAELVKSSWAVEIEEGRSLRRTDRYSVIIGDRVASSMFGEQIGIRSRLTVQDQTFRVIGTSRPTGDPAVDRAILMTEETARDVVDDQETIDWVIVRIQDGFTPEQVKENLKRELRQERNVDEGEEDFTISTPQDILSSFRNILNIVQAITIGIASISLLVGGIGIMNTMYTSISERTREIGVMKAVGARNSQILTIFLIESGMIGLVGGGIGVILGLIMSKTAAHYATQYGSIPFTAYISPELIAGSLLFSFLVGTISGVLPARKAARMDPADALRYE